MYDCADADRTARADCQEAINGWDNPRYFKTHSFQDAILSMVTLQKITGGELPEDVNHAPPATIDPTPPATIDPTPPAAIDPTPPISNDRRPGLQLRVPIRLHHNTPRRAPPSSLSTSSVSSIDSPPRSPASPAVPVIPNHPVHPDRQSTAILSYVRSLSRITGVITDPDAFARAQIESVPAGISHAVDVYLEAHSYDAEAKLTMHYAWETFDDIDDFIDFLGCKGVSKAEANWIYCLAMRV